jgi:hypothetical protein
MKSTNDDDDEGDWDDNSSTEELQMHEPQSFVHYRCHSEIVERWTRGTVLSGVLDVEGRLYVVHRFGVRSLLLEFLTIEESAMFSFGLWYFELRYLDVEDDHKGSLEGVRVDSYALLLPLPSLVASDTYRYSLMTSHWRTWDGSGNVVQPYSMSSSSV